MKISEGLELNHESTGMLIAFVGGGGKTSSIMALADELACGGRKVLITTTTAMFNPKGVRHPNIDVLGDHVTVEGKLKGITKERVDAILTEHQYDVILVEADGSRGLPIKAPAEYEPVIPELTSILVGVIGMDSYGRHIDSSVVHRPEIFTLLTGTVNGDKIDDNAIIRLISGPQGLFKGCPKGAKKVLLLNKALDDGTRATAERIAVQVIETCTDLHSVLIGAVQDHDPIHKLYRGGN